MRSNSGVQGLRFRVEANFLEAMWTSSIGLYWEERVVMWLIGVIIPNSKP